MTEFQRWTMEAPLRQARRDVQRAMEESARAILRASDIAQAAERIGHGFVDLVPRTKGQRSKVGASRKEVA